MSKSAALALNERHVSTAPGLGGDRLFHRNNRPDPRWLAAVKALREGDFVSDGDWDLAYPRKYADVSSLHWSPISVVRRAAALLSRGPNTRILDVGSGVGKFCTIATITTPGIFCGIERWGEMVDVARATAHRAQLSRMRFIHARVEDIDWTNFDGFYFFNPFAELRCPDLRIAGPEAAADPAEYRRLIAFAQESLDLARPRTRVVTYHGFGGEMPSSFRLVLKEPHETDFLEYWEKK